MEANNENFIDVILYLGFKNCNENNLANKDWYCTGEFILKVMNFGWEVCSCIDPDHTPLLHSGNFNGGEFLKAWIKLQTRQESKE
jgi:hypothetical protein